VSDTINAAQPDGGPVPSDPGYAASAGYAQEGPSDFAPPPVNNNTQPPAPPKKSHRLRNTIFGVVGLIVVIIIATNAGGGGKHNGTSSGTSTDPGVSQGVASRDATRDVKLGPVQAPDVLGVRYEKITVVNHSSERSDYMIDVAVQSPDGKTQYDTGSAYITNVDPGQTAIDKVMFTKDIPAGAKAVLKTVERTASL
jgi:hypothetical protein